MFNPQHKHNPLRSTNIPEDTYQRISPFKEMRAKSHHKTINNENDYINQNQYPKGFPHDSNKQRLRDQRIQYSQEGNQNTQQMMAGAPYINYNKESNTYTESIKKIQQNFDDIEDELKSNGGSGGYHRLSIGFHALKEGFSELNRFVNLQHSQIKRHYDYITRLQTAIKNLENEISYLNELTENQDNQIKYQNNQIHTIHKMLYKIIEEKVPKQQEISVSHFAKSFWNVISYQIQEEVKQQIGQTQTVLNYQNIPTQSQAQPTNKNSLLFSGSTKRTEENQYSNQLNNKQSNLQQDKKENDRLFPNIQGQSALDHAKINANVPQTQNVLPQDTYNCLKQQNEKKDLTFNTNQAENLSTQDIILKQPTIKLSQPKINNYENQKVAFSLNNSSSSQKYTVISEQFLNIFEQLLSQIPTNTEEYTLFFQFYQEAKQQERRIIQQQLGLSINNFEETAFNIINKAMVKWNECRYIVDETSLKASLYMCKFIRQWRITINIPQLLENNTESTALRKMLLEAINGQYLYIIKIYSQDNFIIYSKGGDAVVQRFTTQEEFNQLNIDFQYAKNAIISLQTIKVDVRQFKFKNLVFFSKDKVNISEYSSAELESAYLENVEIDNIEKCYKLTSLCCKNSHSLQQVQGLKNLRLFDSVQ